MSDFLYQFSLYRLPEMKISKIEAGAHNRQDCNYQHLVKWQICKVEISVFLLQGG
jgi:hypothetical protein